MNAEEIRGVLDALTKRLDEKLGDRTDDEARHRRRDTVQAGILMMLAEIAAQLAEKNAHVRAKSEKAAPVSKEAVRSTVRRSSANKRFYVAHWGIEAEESMMPDFTPVAGQPHWQDLEVNQNTTGRLGSFDDAKITRRQ